MDGALEAVAVIAIPLLLPHGTCRKVAGIRQAYHVARRSLKCGRSPHPPRLFMLASQTRHAPRPDRDWPTVPRRRMAGKSETPVTKEGRRLEAGVDAADDAEAAEEVHLQRLVHEVGEFVIAVHDREVHAEVVLVGL